jgi:hypothetical protein
MIPHWPNVIWFVFGSSIPCGGGGGEGDRGGNRKIMGSLHSPLCAAKALFSCPAIISQRLEPRIISNEPLENTEEESKII